MSSHAIKVVCKIICDARQGRRSLPIWMTRAVITASSADHGGKRIAESRCVAAGSGPV